MGHITLAAAQREVLERCGHLSTQSVAVEDASGRIMATPLISQLDLPPFANSAMDGFALIAADTQGAAGDHPARLSLVGESRAGEPYPAQLERGCAVRISTGAALPQGADCVLRVEQSRVESDHLLVEIELRRGADVRPAGDDVTSGSVVIPQHAPIGAGEIALASAVGATELDVCRRPRVSVVATGDELIAPGNPLAHGQIHDSNSQMLRRLVLDHGGEIQHIAPRTPDTAEAALGAIERALTGADVLVLCGGVSVGEHDHIKGALAKSGAEEVFWQVALRPGHPTWFGVFNRPDESATLIFGLPGNPVSAWVTFQLFVAPALRRLQGDVREPLRLTARYLGEPISKRTGFAQILRCHLTEEAGELLATLTAQNQRSHALSSLIGAQALMHLPEEVDAVIDGDDVVVHPLGQYTWSDK